MDIGKQEEERLNTNENDRLKEGIKQTEDSLIVFQSQQSLKRQQINEIYFIFRQLISKQKTGMINLDQKLNIQKRMKLMGGGCCGSQQKNIEFKEQRNKNQQIPKQVSNQGKKYEVPPDELLCSVCYNKIQNKQNYKCINDDCDVKQCKACFADFLENQINRGQIAQEQLCCYQCKTPVTPKVIQKICPQKVFKKYNYLKIRDSPGAQQCLTIDCPVIVIVSEGVKEFKCKKCKTINCLECKTQHKNKNCVEQKKKEDDKQQKLFEQWQTDNKTVKCPVCKAITQKVQGCNFIVCRNVCQSKNMFCYLCGKQLTEALHLSHFKTDGPNGKRCNTLDNIPD